MPDYGNSNATKRTYSFMEIYGAVVAVLLLSWVIASVVSYLFPKDGYRNQVFDYLYFILMVFLTFIQIKWFLW